MHSLLTGRLAERRRARRHAQFVALAAVASALAGIFVGWLLLGWFLWPATETATPASMNEAARTDYVELVLESWQFDGDTALARRRLGPWPAADLSAILAKLSAARSPSGDTAGLDPIETFATAMGVDLTSRGADPSSTSIPTGATANSEPRFNPPAPTPLPVRLSIGANVPRSFRLLTEEWAKSQGWSIVSPGEDAQVIIGNTASTGSILLAERYYVVVDRFATLRSEISMAQLKSMWQGHAIADGAASLILVPDALDGLSGLWGPPAPNVRTADSEALVGELWDKSGVLGILPFDRLSPRVLALPLDGQNILAHDFAVEEYPLVVRTFVSGESGLAQKLVTALREKIERTNRDPERITTLIMTGTTAIARTAAYRIEQKKDPAYPARLIGPTLAAADITHISNEISFADNCKPVLDTMSFCSSPSYMATFRLAGVDIVGLTGNHLLDYGTDPFLETLNTYEAAGLKYFGGGRDANEASKTLFLQNHGNRIAFIGANSWGPASVWATAKQPGAQKYDLTVLSKEIADAKKQADLVFVEIQAEENYDYQPSTDNQKMFRSLLVDGADVVTGVQAHQPQAVEFGEEGRGLILYGLGNLFFDQMFQLSVRQELIARHTLYQGRLLQTELLTAILEDSVQPRWMTPTERADLLRSVFGASGWLK